MTSREYSPQKDSFEKLLATPVKLGIINDIATHDPENCTMSEILGRMGYEPQDSGGLFVKFRELEALGIIAVEESADTKDKRQKLPYSLTEEAEEIYADYCDTKVGELIDVLQGLHKQFGIDRGYGFIDQQPK